MLFGAFYLCILPTSTHLQSHRHSSSPKAQRDPKGFHLEDRLDHTLHIPPILELVKAALRLLWCGCSLVARHCESLCSVLPCLWLYHYITISLYVYMSIFLGLCLSLSLSLSPSPVPCGIMWACVIRPVFLGPLCWPQWKIMRCYVQIFDQT